jgi:hypothetical protein
MLDKSRLSFTIRRKKWFLKRDGHKCQAPFVHECDLEHSLQVHHIKPHGYLNVVAPDVCADYPLNGITLCRTAHEMIHPDVVYARNAYHLDNDVFNKLKEQRRTLLEHHRIYWVDIWDRAMEVIALINTRKYEPKHPFPTYKKRKKKDEVPEEE